MGATLTCLRPAPPASSNQSEPIPAQSSPPSPSPPPPTEQPQPEQSSQPQQPRPVIHHQRSPSSDKDSAYRQNFLGESLASCSSGPSSASDTSSLFSTSSGEPSGAFGKWALAACLEGTTHFASASQIARRHYKQGISDRQCVRAILYEHTKQKFASCDAVMRASGVPALDCSSSSLAYDVLMHMRLVSVIAICLNGRVEEAHVRMLVVLLGLGKRVKMLQASSHIMGRDLMTELLDTLPDRLLLLFRSKLASRLRSDTGLHGITKMVKLVPAVSARAKATKHASGGLHRSMSSILDTHSSLGGLLDSYGGHSQTPGGGSSSAHQDLLDSALALASLDKTASFSGRAGGHARSLSLSLSAA